MPGVVEHGLFIGMAALALIAKGDQLIELLRDDREKH
jgi:ribose 5-phosphate isomerase